MGANSIPHKPGSSSSSLPNELSRRKKKWFRSENWFFVVLSSVEQWYLLPVGIAALIAVAAALFRLRSMRKRSEATKFYRLDQQVQMQGFADEDDAGFAYGGRAPKA